MTTHWRWASISPEIKLTLTLDSDDPELIARVEESARANGITIHRIEAEPWPGEALLSKEGGEPQPLPPDYWETAE